MPNKNYLKGRRKEYKEVKRLKENGFEIAQRSAGSHSPIDIFAISRTKRIIKLVQCKPDSMSNNKRKQIEDENNWLNGNFDVSFEVI